MNANSKINFYRNPQIFNFVFACVCSEQKSKQSDECEVKRRHLEFLCFNEYFQKRIFPALWVLSGTFYWQSIIKNFQHVRKHITDAWLEYSLINLRGSRRAFSIGLDSFDVIYSIRKFDLKTQSFHISLVQRLNNVFNSQFHPLKALIINLYYIRLKIFS